MKKSKTVSFPHIHAEPSARSIMLDVAIALIPATAFGIYQFGMKAFLIILTAIATAILSEFTYQNLMQQEVTINDGSALVTGLLLGLNLPADVSLWIPFLGSLFAIIVVKQLFGGIGQNFMNPALAARSFLLISFTGRMTTYVWDGISGATPLADMKAGKSFDLAAMIVGETRGCIGEISAIAILIGAVYLIIKGVIAVKIPVSYILSFLIFMALFGGRGVDPAYLLAQLCGGGLLLGAFFMATDYSSSPITASGQIIFGIFIGILTGIFRVYGASAEGVSYAILCGNLVVPLIEKITYPVALGREAVRDGK